MPTTHVRRRTTAVLVVFAALVLVVTGLLGTAPASGVPLGPAPSEAAITAEVGPYATTSFAVPTPVTGFGGGVIHHPSDTSDGPFPAVVMAPGFLGSSENYAWVGPFLASRGIVTLLMDTNNRTDGAALRGQQALAALDHLTGSSSASAIVDADRLGVVGHSMGGGGALEAARLRPSLRAIVSFQPWHTTKSWSTVTVPALIVGAEDDTTAPVATHSVPFYDSLPASTRSMYAELADTPHRAGTEGHRTQSAALAIWLGRFLQDDTRYEPLLCPAPAGEATLSVLRARCPATATVSGVVDGPDGPVAGATVLAYADTDGWLGSGVATTGSDGSYTLADMTAGAPYRIVVVPPAGSDLVMAWWQGAGRATAVPVVPDAAQPRWGVDVTLGSATTRISGVVSGPDGPLAGVDVWAYAPGDSWVGSVATTTDAEGRYTLRGLSVDPQRIRFGPPPGSGLAVQWYDGAVGRGTATPVLPIEDATLTGIDATLSPA